LLNFLPGVDTETSASPLKHRSLSFAQSALAASKSWQQICSKNFSVEIRDHSHHEPFQSHFVFIFPLHHFIKEDQKFEYF